MLKHRLFNIFFFITAGIVAFFIYNLLYSEQKISYVPFQPQIQIKKIQPPRTGAYLGISQYDRDYKNILSLQKDTGKHFAIIGIYQSWGDAKNNFDFNWANMIKNQNSIPLITWEPWIPVAGYDRSEQKVDQKKFRLIHIANGDFDNYIKKFADDVKSYKYPVMIRFAHEMNGNWYSWGSKFNTPGEYIAAWRHVHDIFLSEGATNVTWLWSPNAIYVDSQVPYAGQIKMFYPGDKYVDWVGFSAFNWAGIYKQNVWQTPSDLYTTTISDLATLNKPIIIAETASAGSSFATMKAEWIKELAVYIKKNPEIKGAIWFNAKDNGIDWRLESTPASRDAFKNAFDDYFLNFQTGNSGNH